MTGKPPWSQFSNTVTVMYHLACQDTLPEYPDPSRCSVDVITFLNICLQRNPTKRPDITSLLLHPFVASTGGLGGWGSSAQLITRPSTVSSTPMEDISPGFIDNSLSVDNNNNNSIWRQDLKSRNFGDRIRDSEKERYREIERDKASVSSALAQHRRARMNAQTQQAQSAPTHMLPSSSSSLELASANPEITAPISMSTPSTARTQQSGASTSSATVDSEDSIGITPRVHTMPQHHQTQHQQHLPSQYVHDSFQMKPSDSMTSLEGADRPTSRSRSSSSSSLLSIDEENEEVEDDNNVNGIGESNALKSNEEIREARELLEVVEMGSPCGDGNIMSGFGSSSLYGNIDASMSVTSNALEDSMTSITSSNEPTPRRDISNHHSHNQHRPIDLDSMPIGRNKGQLLDRIENPNMIPPISPVLVRGQGQGQGHLMKGNSEKEKNIHRDMKSFQSRSMKGNSSSIGSEIDMIINNNNNSSGSNSSSTTTATYRREQHHVDGQLLSPNYSTPRLSTSSSQKADQFPILLSSSKKALLSYEYASLPSARGLEKRNNSEQQQNISLHTSTTTHTQSQSQGHSQGQGSWREGAGGANGGNGSGMNTSPHEEYFKERRPSKTLEFPDGGVGGSSGGGVNGLFSNTSSSSINNHNGKDHKKSEGDDDNDNDNDFVQQSTRRPSKSANLLFFSADGGDSSPSMQQQLQQSSSSSISNMHQQHYSDHSQMQLEKHRDRDGDIDESKSLSLSLSLSLTTFEGIPRKLSTTRLEGPKQSSSRATTNGPSKIFTAHRPTGLGSAGGEADRDRDRDRDRSRESERVPRKGPARLGGSSSVKSLLENMNGSGNNILMIQPIKSQGQGQGFGQNTPQQNQMTCGFSVTPSLLFNTPATTTTASGSKTPSFMNSLAIPSSDANMNNGFRYNSSSSISNNNNNNTSSSIATSTTNPQRRTSRGRGTHTNVNPGTESGCSSPLYDQDSLIETSFSDVLDLKILGAPPSRTQSRASSSVAVGVGMSATGTMSSRLTTRRPITGAPDIEDSRHFSEEEYSENSITDGTQALVYEEHMGAVTRLCGPRKTRGVLVSSSLDGTIKVWGGNSTESRVTLTAATSTATAPSKGAANATGAAEDALNRGDPSKSSANTSTVKFLTVWTDEVCENIWGGSSDGVLRVWSSGEGRSLRMLKGHEDGITALAGFEAGAGTGSGGNLQNPSCLIVSGSLDRTVRVWDLRVRRSQVLLFKGHTDAVSSVHWGDYGRAVVSASKDKTVRIWDSRSGRIRSVLEKHFSAVTSVKPIPDFPQTAGSGGGGRRSTSGEGPAYVTSGRDSMLHLWTQSGELVGTQSAHRGSVNCLSAVRTDIPFSYSTQSTPLVLSGGSDGLVRLWDLRRLKLLSEVSCGVTNKVCWIGHSFITGGANGSLKLWDYTLTTDSNSGLQSRDWSCRDLLSHPQSCTDLMCNDNFVASGSKCGQIIRWSR
eukprot:gene7673-15706_t